MSPRNIAALPSGYAAWLAEIKPELGARRYGYGFDVHSAQGIVGHAGGTFGASDNLDTFLRSHWTAVVLSNYTENAWEDCEPVVDELRALVAASAHSAQRITGVSRTAHPVQVLNAY